MIVRVGGQTFQPVTCFCALKQGIMKDGPDWTSVTVEQEEVIRRCEGHSHLDEISELWDAIQRENRAYSRAVATVRAHLGASIVSWYVDVSTRIVHFRVKGWTTELQDALEDVDWIEVEYLPAE
jgi:hypothetical protein